MTTEQQRQVRQEYTRICGISDKARDAKYQEMNNVFCDNKEITRLAFRRYERMRKLLALFQQHKPLKQE